MKDILYITGIFAFGILGTAILGNMLMLFLPIDFAIPISIIVIIFFVLILWEKLLLEK